MQCWDRNEKKVFIYQPFSTFYLAVGTKVAGYMRHNTKITFLTFPQVNYAYIKVSSNQAHPCTSESHISSQLLGAAAECNLMLSAKNVLLSSSLSTPFALMLLTLLTY